MSFFAVRKFSTLTTISQPIWLNFTQAFATETRLKSCFDKNRTHDFRTASSSRCALLDYLVQGVTEIVIGGYFQGYRR